MISSNTYSVHSLLSFWESNDINVSSSIIVPQAPEGFFTVYFLSFQLR